jgi:protein-S-isoprenylcysteine O-methyltransferase Ste14
MLLLRAIFAFLVLPGIVGYAIPWWMASAQPEPSGAQQLGWVPMVGGTALLLWCVREFYVAGRGTLAPWSPPRYLVTTGPYRRCRNPMYAAVTTLLLGWAVLFWSQSLALYAACVAAMFHLRVVLFEEPWAARRFGDEWHAYCARVPRWVRLGRTSSG